MHAYTTQPNVLTGRQAHRYMRAAAGARTQAGRSMDTSRQGHGHTCMGGTAGAAAMGVCTALLPSVTTGASVTTGESMTMEVVGAVDSVGLTSSCSGGFKVVGVVESVGLTSSCSGG